MMHRDFLRDLSPEDRNHLTAKTNANAVVRLLLLTGMISLVTSGLVSGSSIWPVLVPVQGLLLISLFHLLHECIHDTPFRTRRINRIIGSVCGFILFLPCEWFRYFHRDHHRYTQIEGKDPELATAKPATRVQWLLHISGLPLYKSLFLIFCQVFIGRNLDSFIPEKARSSVVNEVRVMLLSYSILIIASVWLKSSLLLWVWLVPLWIGQPFLRLYLLAEHTLCENNEDMFHNTRTVISNPVVRWFTWNMPFHTEHHVYPGVPFHKLPLLHEKMQDFLVHKDISYTDFNKHLYATMK